MAGTLVLSPDKATIGFKQIHADGTQIPSLFDLETSNITALAKPSSLCGQPSFSSNGKTAFTIGNELTVIDGSQTKTYNLGVYANLTPISPDGNYVIYNNDNDRLLLLDLSTGASTQITDSKRGDVYFLNGRPMAIRLLTQRYQALYLFGIKPPTKPTQ